MGDDTNRVPFIIERTQVPEQHRENYDQIAETRGSVRGPFSALLNSPDVAGRIAHVGTYVRYESGLPGTAREIAILTTAREFECAYEWAAHVPLAKDEGVSAHLIEAVATQAPLENASEPESLVIEYGRTLFGDNEVPDDLFYAIKEQFGTQGTVDLTAMMGYYGMLACLINAFRITPDSNEPDFS